MNLLLLSVNGEEVGGEVTGATASLATSKCDIMGMINLPVWWSLSGRRITKIA
jgi:hypothetical protein